MKTRELFELARLSPDELILARKACKLLETAKRNARVHKLPFNLELWDIETPLLCPVLGLPLDYQAEGYRSPLSASLDRTIPRLGYVKGNVVTMSWRANHLKSNGSIEEFRLLLDYLGYGNRSWT